MSFEQFKAKDIQMTQEHDLVVVDGDFVSELSDDRHVNMIIISAKGNFRFAPFLGVDISAFLNAVGSTRNALNQQRRSILEDEVSLQLDYQLLAKLVAEEMKKDSNK